MPPMTGVSETTLRNLCGHFDGIRVGIADSACWQPHQTGSPGTVDDQQVRTAQGRAFGNQATARASAENGSVRLGFGFKTRKDLLSREVFHGRASICAIIQSEQSAANSGSLMWCSVSVTGIEGTSVSFMLSRHAVLADGS